MSLTGPNSTQTLLWCLCLKFSVGSLLILSLADVPAKPAVEANLYMLILYHLCNGHILLMWEGEQRQVPNYHPMTYGGVIWVTLG